jgi:hypothetical protein
MYDIPSNLYVFWTRVYSKNTKTYETCKDLSISMISFNFKIIIYLIKIVFK